jgi:hypothetical protein
VDGRDRLADAALEADHGDANGATLHPLLHAGTTIQVLGYSEGRFGIG